LPRGELERGTLMHKKYKGRMIKGLASLFVGMFMLLWSPPLAWSVTQDTGEVATGEGTTGLHTEQEPLNPSTDTSSVLDSNIFLYSSAEIELFSSGDVRLVPVTSQSTEGEANDTFNCGKPGCDENAIPNAVDEIEAGGGTAGGAQETIENEVRTDEIIKRYNEDENLVATLVRIKNATVNSGEDGRVILVSGSITVVGPEEEDGLVALLVITDSTITTGKLILVDENGTIVSAVPFIIDKNGKIKVLEGLANLSNETIKSTTTEAAIQLDGSDVNALGGGIFNTTGTNEFAGPVAKIENATIKASDIFRVGAGGTVKSTTSEALYHVKESNLSLDSIMVILGGEVDINGELGHFENTDVTTTFDALSIANDGKLKTNDPNKPVLRIEGGTWEIGEFGFGSLVNLAGTGAPPPGGPPAGGPPAADPTSRPIEGPGPSGHAFEATGGADISIERNAVTVDNALWDAMRLAIVGAVGDPVTKITTANSFVEANNSKIEFFEPTHLTNALINVTQGDFLTVNGGEMIFHKDFLRMNNADIQVVDGFLINVMNGGSLDIKGKLAVGIGGVNTIVVNNTAPVTGIQNGIPFTSDPTATVQIGANPLQGVNLNVTGSAINAGFNSSVKINTP